VFTSCPVAPRNTKVEEKEKQEMNFQGKKNSGQRKGIIPVNLGFRFDGLNRFSFGFGKLIVLQQKQCFKLQWLYYLN